RAAVAPQPLHELQAVAVRQAEIEQHQVVHRLVELALGVLQAAHPGDIEATVQQRDANAVAEIEVVFNKQNVHGPY
ncbi:conserved hypothetical protein, partial [Ricinus communis]